MTFTPRLTRPEAGNKYYIRKAQGGWNPCIKGNPTDSACNVLSNCVGYAIGRFNEIGGWGACKYLRSTNAENFLQVKGELRSGTEPRLGAIIVWQKGATLSGSDGAGHVAVVEQINADGSIVTSESGWGCSAFWTKRRTNANGRWGASSGYKFLGFIYQPEDFDGVADAPVVDAKPEEPVEEDDVGALTVDGLWGPATTKRLQEIFNLEVTGTIAGQIDYYRARNPGLRTGWRWVPREEATGDYLIIALQQWAGMPQWQWDGLLGPATIRALQTELGTPVDGVVSRPSMMVKALQRWANKQP